MFRRRKRFENVVMLTLGPNDRLVVETAERLSEHQLEMVREHLALFAKVDKDRVLIVYNATLKVLREGEPPPPPVILDPGRWV